MTVHELQGRAHAAAIRRVSPGAARRALRGCTRRASRGSARRASPGQGTVEYVGLILLIAVLIAGVVSASRSFSDTGIAEAVVKKIKGAIDGVAEAR
jgi:hypothetical protein